MAAWRWKKLKSEGKSGWAVFGDSILNIFALTAVICAIIYASLSWDDLWDGASTEYNVDYKSSIYLPNVLVCNSDSTSYVTGYPEFTTYYYTDDVFANGEVSDDTGMNVTNTIVTLAGTEFACSILDTSGNSYSFTGKQSGLYINLTMASASYQPKVFVGLYSSAKESDAGGVDTQYPELATLAVLSGYGTQHFMMFEKRRLIDKYMKTTNDNYTYSVTSDPYKSVYSTGATAEALESYYSNLYVIIMPSSFQITEMTSRNSVVAAFNNLGGFWSVFEMGFTLTGLVIFLVFFCFQKKQTGSRLARDLDDKLKSSFNKAKSTVLVPCWSNPKVKSNIVPEGETDVSVILPTSQARSDDKDDADIEITVVSSAEADAAPARSMSQPPQHAQEEDGAGFRTSVV